MSEQKKIYLVFQGKFLDCDIITTFSTKEKAEEFVKTFQPRSNFTHEQMFIEEREIDEDWPKLPNGYAVYTVWMNKNGTVIDVLSTKPYNWEYQIKNPTTFSLTFENMSHTCLARNEKHAIKITNEARTKAIAENKFGD